MVCTKVLLNGKGGGVKPAPYFLFFAPNWRVGSGGLDAFHRLSQQLLDRGYDSFLFPCVQNPRLHTQLFTPTIARLMNGRPMITVYPESYPTMLRGELLVRWILHHEVEQTLDADMWFVWDTDYLKTITDYSILRNDEVDESIFYDDGRDRTGHCWYAFKDREPVPEHIRDGIDLNRIKRGDKRGLAEAMRSSRYCVCREYSGIEIEAALCGCPVVKSYDDIDLGAAEVYRKKLISDYRNAQQQKDAQITHFIEKCIGGCR